MSYELLPPFFLVVLFYFSWRWIFQNSIHFSIPFFFKYSMVIHFKLRQKLSESHIWQIAVSDLRLRATRRTYRFTPVSTTSNHSQSRGIFVLGGASIADYLKSNSAGYCSTCRFHNLAARQRWNWYPGMGQKRILIGQVSVAQVGRRRSFLRGSTRIFPYKVYSRVSYYCGTIILRCRTFALCNVRRGIRHANVLQRVL